MEKLSSQECLIVFVGQAPPKVPAAVPFGRTRLYKWLETIGLEQKETLTRCAFTALVAKFPGKADHGDLKPSRDEILKFRPKLAASLARFPKAVVVPVGTMAVSELLDCQVKQVSEFVGKRFVKRISGTLEERVIVPLPHPSGGSAWPYLPGNRDLLKQALDILKTEISMRRDPKAKES